MSGIGRALPRPSLRLPTLGALPPRPVLRRRLLIFLLIALALAAGYLLWLRNSSLVAVEQVLVVGADRHPEIGARLSEAGREQTTLNVDRGALEAVVASEPAVRSVTATPDFPHGLTIEVDVREPVGWLRSPGLVVAGDGVVLERENSAPEGVPAIRLEAKGRAAPGAAVEGQALRVARLLGAAPAPLAREVSGAKTDPTIGVVVTMSGGLELRFGDPGAADRKWLAAAAVLADRGFTTASYLDLSVPERPVAGGVPEALEEEEVPGLEAGVEPAPAPAEAVPAAPPPTLE